jgi:hypothetical protein
MFTLHFHRLVCEILDWTEAPGSTYVNLHMGILSKRKMQTTEKNNRLLGDFEELRLYITDTYPAYFGVILRVGENALKNRHLITNHQVWTLDTHFQRVPLA